MNDRFAHGRGIAAAVVQQQGWERRSWTKTRIARKGILKLLLCSIRQRLSRLFQHSSVLLPFVLDYLDKWPHFVRLSIYRVLPFRSIFSSILGREEYVLSLVREERRLFSFGAFVVCFTSSLMSRDNGHYYLNEAPVS